MNMQTITHAVVAAILCLAYAGAARGDNQARKVPAELAKVLTAAQEDLRRGEPAVALAKLVAYKGDDHALRQLLIGHARVRQANHQAAIAAYQASLRMDPELLQAGLGLAQVYAQLENWRKSAEMLGRFIDTDSCDADTLLLYAQVAQQLKDARLSELLVDKAIRRFPTDLRFRRLDLAGSMDRQDYRGARQAVAALLEAEPADADLWRQRAFVANRTEKPAEAIAAFEACLLCDPNDLAKHRGFVAALVIAGDWPSAMRHGEKLLAGTLAESASANVELMGLLVRAADMGRRDKALARWLALVPENSRTTDMGIIATRLAVRLGEIADARAALAGLIERDRADAGIFLWAGHLAEKAKDWPEAETLYVHASRQKGPSAEMASLYLARLLIHRDRAVEAARLLKAYLDQRPQDAAARALLAIAIAKARTASPPAAGGRKSTAAPRQ